MLSEPNIYPSRDYALATRTSGVVRVCEVVRRKPGDRLSVYWHVYGLQGIPGHEAGHMQLGHRHKHEGGEGGTALSQELKASC
jgi:hypothetical protein